MRYSFRYNNIPQPVDFRVYYFLCTRLRANLSEPHVDLGWARSNMLVLLAFVALAGLPAPVQIRATGEWIASMGKISILSYEATGVEMQLRQLRRI